MAEVTPHYEALPHTGDIRLRVTAATLPELFAHAGWALFDQMVDLTNIAPYESHEIRVEAETLDELFRAWLSELLFRFSTDGLVFSQFEDVDLEKNRLSARALGERFDPKRHPLKTELKAITYHQLLVTFDDGQWVAQVVVDV